MSLASTTRTTPLASASEGVLLDLRDLMQQLPGSDCLLPADTPAKTIGAAHRRAPANGPTRWLVLIVRGGAVRRFAASQG